MHAPSKAYLETAKIETNAKRRSLMPFMGIEALSEVAKTILELEKNDL